MSPNTRALIQWMLAATTAIPLVVFAEQPNRPIGPAKQAPNTTPKKSNPPAPPSEVKTAPKGPVEMAPGNTHTITVERGALHMCRGGPKKRTLYCWTVDGGNVKLANAVQLSGDDSVAIELKKDVTGVFYSDVWSDSPMRLTINGSVKDGKIALPMPAKHFEPLLVAPFLTLNAVNPAPAGLLATQNAVFAQANNAMKTADDEVQRWVENEKDVLKKASDDLHQLVEQRGMSLLKDEYQGKAIQMRDAFKSKAEELLFNRDGRYQGSAADAEEMLKTQRSRVQSARDCILGSWNNGDAESAQPSQTIMHGLWSLNSAQGEDATSELDDADAATWSTAADGVEATVLQKINSCLSGASVNMDTDDLTLVSPFLNEAQSDDDEANGDKIPFFQAIYDEGALIDQGSLEAKSDAIEADAERLHARLEAAHDPERLLGGFARLENSFNAWITGAFPDDFVKAEPPGNNQNGKSAKTAGQPPGNPVLAQQCRCSTTTFSFNFNVLGMEVVIGTPLADSICVTDDMPHLVLSWAGDDCITTGPSWDVIHAGGGNDEVYSGDHHDVVFGGTGNDTIWGGGGKSYEVQIGAARFKFDIGNLICGGAGVDTIHGGEDGMGGLAGTPAWGFTDVIFGDWITGSQDGDHIFGHGGIDFLFGMGGNDDIHNDEVGAVHVWSGAWAPAPMGSFFFGGSGNDTITGSNGAVPGALGDAAFGGDGNDDIKGGKDMDLLLGNNGTDTIRGGDDLDLIFGGPDGDFLYGDDGINLVAGGRGADTCEGGTGVFDITIGNKDGDTSLKAGSTMGIVVGGDGNDNIYGNSGQFYLLIGSAGEDNIVGQSGLTIIFGGKQDDTIATGTGVNTLTGAYTLSFGGDHADTITGGSGTNFIFGNSNDDAPAPKGPAHTIDFKGWDQLICGPEANVVFGNRGSDRIEIHGGPNFVFGGLAHDRIEGANHGTGVHLIFGGAGDDLIQGTGGTDFAFGNKGDDTITDAGGTNILAGNDGADTITGGPGTDFIFGGPKDDTLNGGGGRDMLFGGDGQDSMHGDNGPGTDDIDIMFGGPNPNSQPQGIFGDGGSDLLFGGSGPDRLDGAGGTNAMFGLGGDDTIIAWWDRNWAFGGGGNDSLYGAPEPVNATNPSTPYSDENTRDFLFGGGGTNNKSWANKKKWDIVLQVPLGNRVRE